MPVIAGNKYSCEPCIRGHRATHCNHVDRILIEVRKPGRPLDRCAHTIGSCHCSKHLKNSTVVEVREVSVSAGGKGKKSKSKSKSPSPVENEMKTVTISKEMPFARELRISRVGGSPASSRSSSISEDESVFFSTGKSQILKMKGGVETGGERRRSKVFKRHRLNKSDEPLCRNVPPSLDLDLDVDVVMEGDEEEETPALSPSYSESGSERSIPAYFDHKSQSQAEPALYPGPDAVGEKMEAEMDAPQVVLSKDEGVPPVVFRGISISQLLS